MPRTLIARRTMSAPAATVWGLVADPMGRPVWDKSVSRVDIITAGPVRRGGRYRLTRSSLGITSREERHVIAYLDGVATITHATGGPLAYDSAVVVVPRGSTTSEVILTLDIEDDSALGRALGIAVGLAASQVESLMARALRDLATEAARREALRPPPPDPAI